MRCRWVCCCCCCYYHGMSQRWRPRRAGGGSRIRCKYLHCSATAVTIHIYTPYGLGIAGWLVADNQGRDNRSNWQSLNSRTFGVCDSIWWELCKDIFITNGYLHNMHPTTHSTWPGIFPNHQLWHAIWRITTSRHASHATDLPPA